MPGTSEAQIFDVMNNILIISLYTWLNLGIKETQGTVKTVLNFEVVLVLGSISMSGIGLRVGTDVHVHVAVLYSHVVSIHWWS